MNIYFDSFCDLWFLKNYLSIIIFNSRILEIYVIESLEMLCDTVGGWVGLSNFHGGWLHAVCVPASVHAYILQIVKKIEKVFLICTFCMCAKTKT